VTGHPVLRRVRARVRGAVQGVGFRPYVYRLAAVYGLSGFVENTAAGVTLEAEGGGDAIARFLDAVKSPPAPAAIAEMLIEDVPVLGGQGFAIRQSAVEGARLAQILPDLAMCSDCLRELFDPNDRRHLYPFINCTHCGPRYSIVEDVPYDRARTAMRHFEMCAACKAEYENPLDRRFHAEPNACPDCGPEVALWNGEGAILSRRNVAILEAAEAIRAGKIVAVKGIGGFHLIADACNDTAVSALRLRKRRPHKPLAVMFPSLAQLEEACETDGIARALLESLARPIVLLRRKQSGIAASVAPGNPWLGAFLAYAPLHHLLLRELGFPVVATSGNLSDEPIAIDETEALTRLAGIADLFLVHNRPIVRPLDDSVMRVVAGRDMMLRRARGFAPAPIAIEKMPAGILALGGHMKTTVALSVEGAALQSQHIGDMETAEARLAHKRAIADLVRLRACAPRLVAHDLHPDYATTREAARMGLAAFAVQHHVAHIAAVMAENEVAPPVLGIAWDGTGYGPDGTVWGGEFLLITKSGYERVAHLRPFRLPGGEAAAREPRRSAMALLYEARGETHDAWLYFTEQEQTAIAHMLRGGINAPWTSSMGRLFDGFAALAGLRQVASYEGQGAAEFEWAADGFAARAPYEFVLRGGLLDWQGALEALLEDRANGVPAGEISAAFHAGLALAIVDAARKFGTSRIALTGGCFQNKRLSEAAIAALRAAGFGPVWHRRSPPNDGAIALGQAVWAGWHAGGAPCV
jgi:hydrogenase maturation protein HypF